MPVNGRAGPPGSGKERSHRLKALNTPTPTRVRIDGEGRPARVLLNRRSREVTAVRESWRIDDEWWRKPISRRYWKVILDGGQPLTLFLDRSSGRWFLQEG